MTTRYPGAEEASTVACMLLESERERSQREMSQRQANILVDVECSKCAAGKYPGRCWMCVIEDLPCGPPGVDKETGSSLEGGL